MYIRETVMYIRETVKILDSLEVSEAVRKKLYQDNAVRLLGLTVELPGTGAVSP